MGSGEDREAAVPSGSPGTSPLDLAANIPGYDVTIERSESPLEHSARIVKESRRALIADWMWVGLGSFIGLLTLLFLWVLFVKSDATADERALAGKVLISLISATISFVLGRLSGK